MEIDNELARAFGIMEAATLVYMSGEWASRKHGTKEITVSAEDVANKLGFSSPTFRRIMRRWEKAGFLKIERKGIPAKMWYQIDDKKFSAYTEKALKGSGKPSCHSYTLRKSRKALYH